ncbi:MmcQ/YjbR family DNA-binding protein [Arthrobacter sp. KK5.5]|uniref:MmcQ/YjbR family DNA-binding protein n=1 Tax=Arthrobacter sp. KK5.5 TaxID=3373084 RepID=UPI003EE4704F
MDYQWIRRTCLALPAAFEDFPFGQEAAVFRVRGRTASPALAEQLRMAHPEITPGFHRSKRHWNTVDCGGALGERAVRDMIEDSYDLVVERMPRADREILARLGE